MGYTLHKRSQVTYAFIFKHRFEHRIRMMCRVLLISWSGYYAWLKEPVSKRARADIHQTALLREASLESGKVYGYRKFHDDLQGLGEQCSLNRIERLTRLAGIRAQVGYKKRPKNAYKCVNIRIWGSCPQ